MLGSDHNSGPMTNPRQNILPAAILAAALALGDASADAAPRVVVTIQPVHALIAGVMDGIATPTLLVTSYGSPHTYQLRPSNARALSDADAVFWIGDQLEVFLIKSLASLGADAKIVEIAELDGIELLQNREGGAWDDHATLEHPADTYDPHLWLNPRNAVRIINAAVGVLSEIDPDHAAHYAQNGKQFARKIQTLDAEIEQRLKAVRDHPFVVLHDAYQYLEVRFGLNAVGSVTVSPERQPSARRLRELRSKIDMLGVRCILAEPQFNTAQIAMIADTYGATIGVLDSLGAAIEPGPDAYEAMMRANMESLLACLGPAN